MLYEEDHFHPTHLDVTLEDLKSTNKKPTNKLDIVKKVKGSDPNYLVKYIEHNKKSQQKKKTEAIEMYGSGDIGSHIRNAVSGHRTPHLVGSKDEDLYFSVIESSGINGRNEGVRLFYDSPEQFESHFRIILNQEIKERWHNKFLQANK